MVRDPRDTSLYGFVGNDPVGSVDYFGLTGGRPQQAETAYEQIIKDMNCATYALAPYFGFERVLPPINLTIDASASQYLGKWREIFTQNLGCREKAESGCEPEEYEIYMHVWRRGAQKNNPNAGFHMLRKDADGTWSERSGPGEPVKEKQKDPVKQYGTKAEQEKAGFFPRWYCCPQCPAPPPVIVIH